MTRTDRNAELLRPFRTIVLQRARSDAAFQVALIEEAAQNILDRDIDIALGQLRDIVNATMGFEVLATATSLPKTSLMRMLGPQGNPRAGNLGRIIQAIRTDTGVHLVARIEPVVKPEAAQSADASPIATRRAGPDITAPCRDSLCAAKPHSFQ